MGLRTWTRDEIDAERQRIEKIIELSDRKMQILRLVAQGHTNVEISQRLHLSNSMVKRHLLEAAGKLGAHVIDRAHIIARAYESGVLQRGDTQGVNADHVGVR